MGWNLTGKFGVALLSNGFGDSVALKKIEKVFNSSYQEVELQTLAGIQELSPQYGTMAGGWYLPQE